MRYALWITASALFISAGASRATELLPASAVRQNLLSSCFIDVQEGWVAADLGRVFHTVDGGKNWEKLEATKDQRSFVALSCPDREHLWAAGQAGLIGLSRDGGKTWTMQNSGTDRQLLDIAFSGSARDSVAHSDPTGSGPAEQMPAAGPRRGIAVGDFGTIVRTDDGGATWAKMPLPRDTKLPPDVVEIVDPGDVVLYALSFPAPEHAWAVGEFGVILESTDGGLTWHSQDSPVETSLFGVSFADEQHGWAVGIESTLIATTDGGATWRKQAIETPRGFSLALYDVQVRGSYGWAVGNNGLLLYSKDAGATWQLTKVPVQMGSSWLRGVSLFPDGRGFVVGSRGLVLAMDRETFTPFRQF